MRSKSIHEPSGKSSRPEPIDQTDPLTEEQKSFAGVLGRALADAWRRKWREAANTPNGSSRKSRPEFPG